MMEPLPPGLPRSAIEADAAAVRRMVEGSSPEAVAVACRLIREWCDLFGVAVPDWSRLAAAYAAAWRGVPDWALVAGVQAVLEARAWRTVPLPGEVRAVALERLGPVLDALRTLEAAAMVCRWEGGRDA